MSLHIHPVHVRNLMLSCLGLSHPFPAAAQKSDVLDTIRRLGGLQIDTIHVVARSPYFVLWSRLGEYDPAWLDQLLSEKALFEYWSHAACFLPIEDYPLYRRMMLNGVRGWRDPQKWIQDHSELVERILSSIREKGPLRSADFENPNHTASGWWNWKEEKIALEHLHTAGVLMISSRKNFQRIYDLQERVLPGWDDALTPPPEEVLRSLVLRSVSTLGIARRNWIADYFYLPKSKMPSILKSLVQSGELIEVEVEGWTEPAYLHPGRIENLDRVCAGEDTPDLTTLLSPFDPLISDRARAQALFNFDYSIECYTPAAKRRYGYFSLPILHRGSLVGRLDAKANRQQGRFEVRSLFFEPGVALSEELVSDLGMTLIRCAAWHKTPEVLISHSSPPEARDLLIQIIK